jgi:glycosyltransferase involved in cell wall biosynthesis
VRVLMLSWEYPPNVTGGLGSHLAGLAPALVRAGVEVHVITPQSASPSPSPNGSIECEDKGGEVTEDGVTVHRVPLAKDTNNIYEQARITNQSMQAKAQALLARGDRFDLIHAHDWLVVFSAYELKHTFRLPLIATIHATEQGRIRGGILRTELQRNIHGAEWLLVYEAWRVITCSHYMATEVQSFFRAPAEKIDVVPNGVERPRNGRCSTEDLANKRSHYAGPERKIVFAVGRLVYEKGFHLLVNAAPRILSEFPNTQFVIAGRGPEAVPLAQQASRLGVADDVKFPGYIANQDRDCLYQLAACAVFPSLYEPFGIVALEAMATGCPVIVSKVGGLREVVRNGRTGVTVYPDDAQSLALGVIATLRDPARAAARAARAQEVVYRDFNWDTIAAQTIAVYQRVIAERGRIDW